MGLSWRPRQIVLPRQSEIMVNALRGCDGYVRCALYTGAEHEESWQLAYADPELLQLQEWLLQQTLE